MSTTSGGLNRKRNYDNRSPDKVLAEEKSGRQKMEVSVETELCPVLIKNVDKKYQDNPQQIKNDLDNYYVDVKLKEVKITATGDMIIYFYDAENINKFLSSEPLFKGCKRILLNKTSDNMVLVVKGMSPEIAQKYMDELKHQGIVEILPFNSKVEDYKMFKAVCCDKETRNRIINEGVHIDYCIYRAEQYIRPTKPLKCFKCQRTGHMAVNCQEKEDISMCMKCGDNHRASSCTVNKENFKCE